MSHPQPFRLSSQPSPASPPIPACPVLPAPWLCPTVGIPHYVLSGPWEEDEIRRDRVEPQSVSLSWREPIPAGAPGANSTEYEIRYYEKVSQGLGVGDPGLHSLLWSALSTRVHWPLRWPPRLEFLPSVRWAPRSSPFPQVSAHHKASSPFTPCLPHAYSCQSCLGVDPDFVCI